MTPKLQLKMDKKKLLKDQKMKTIFQNKKLYFKVNGQLTLLTEILMMKMFQLLPSLNQEKSCKLTLKSNLKNLQVSVLKFLNLMKVVMFVQELFPHLYLKIWYKTLMKVYYPTLFPYVLTDLNITKEKQYQKKENYLLVGKVYFSMFISIKPNSLLWQEIILDFSISINP